MQTPLQHCDISRARRLLMLLRLEVGGQDLIPSVLWSKIRACLGPLVEEIRANLWQEFHLPVEAKITHTRVVFFESNYVPHLDHQQKRETNRLILPKDSLSVTNGLGTRSDIYQLNIALRLHPLGRRVEFAICLTKLIICSHWKSLVCFCDSLPEQSGQSICYLRLVSSKLG